MLAELSACAWLGQGEPGSGLRSVFPEALPAALSWFSLPTFELHVFPCADQRRVKPSLPFQDQDKTVTRLGRERDPAPFSPPSIPFLLPPCFCAAHPPAKLLRVLNAELRTRVTERGDNILLSCSSLLDPDSSPGQECDEGRTDEFSPHCCKASRADASGFQ